MEATWKIEEGKNMDVGAERETVAKKQGSRGSVAVRNEHRKILKKRQKIHPKSVKIGGNNRKSTQNQRKSVEKLPKINPRGLPEAFQAPGSGLRRCGIDWDGILGGQMGPQGRPNRSGSR